MKHKHYFLLIPTLLLAAILLNTLSAANVTADEEDKYKSERQYNKEEWKDLKKKNKAEGKELKKKHKEEKKALKKKWKEFRESEGRLSDSDKKRSKRI